MNLIPDWTRSYETNISAIQPQDAQRSRFSGTDVHQRRTAGPFTAARQRAETPGRARSPQKIIVDNRFPALFRLKNKKEIQAVFARRDSFRGERLIFYRARRTIDLPIDGGEPAEKGEKFSRFCLMVSKKCGKAVRRNRIKRVLREIIRKNSYRIAPGYDFNIKVVCERLADIVRITEKDFFGDFERYFGWN